MSIKNRMHVNGKIVDIAHPTSNAGIDAPPPDGLIISLADNTTEVRGYGRPIAPNFAKLIINDYCIKSKDADACLKAINNGQIKTIEDLKAHSGFTAVNALLDSRRHIVSGVFGKEIILQLLSEKGAEGIRYSFGVFNNRTTIVLTSVAEIQKGKENFVSLPSVLVKKPNFYRDLTPFTKPDPNNPIHAEVHGNSLTVEKMLEDFNKMPTAKKKSSKSKIELPELKIKLEKNDADAPLPLNEIEQDFSSIVFNEL